MHGQSWQQGCLLETNPGSATSSLQDILFTLSINGFFSTSPSLGNHSHRFQNPIIAKWLLLLFHQLRPKSDISTDACKENCPCGETSKPPHCSGRPCDSASLPVGRINPGVHIFPLPQTCRLIGSKPWKMSQYSGKVSRATGADAGASRAGPKAVSEKCAMAAPAAAGTLPPL